MHRQAASHARHTETPTKMNRIGQTIMYFQNHRDSVARYPKGTLTRVPHAGCVYAA